MMSTLTRDKLIPNVDSRFDYFLREFVENVDSDTDFKRLLPTPNGYYSSKWKILLTHTESQFKYSTAL